MKYSGAVAVVEVAGLPTAIACADAMVKSANITLIGYEITKGGPGMVNVKICGDIGAVKAAVDAGCLVANQITQVVSRVIMPRPHKDLEPILLNRNPEAFFSRYFDTVAEATPDGEKLSSVDTKEEEKISKKLEEKGQETEATKAGEDAQPGEKGPEKGKAKKSGEQETSEKEGQNRETPTEEKTGKTKERKAKKESQAKKAAETEKAVETDKKETKAKKEAKAEEKAEKETEHEDKTKAKQVKDSKGSKAEDESPASKNSSEGSKKKNKKNK